jgi:hypothetical protein
LIDFAIDKTTKYSKEMKHYILHFLQHYTGLKPALLIKKFKKQSGKVSFKNECQKIGQMTPRIYNWVQEEKRGKPGVFDYIEIEEAGPFIMWLYFGKGLNQALAVQGDGKSIRLSMLQRLIGQGCILFYTELLITVHEISYA